MATDKEQAVLKVSDKTSDWLPLVVTPSLSVLLRHQLDKWDMSC